MKKKRELKPLAELLIGRYPLRTCRTMHDCEICSAPIALGQRYYDGGYGRRIHESCAKYEGYNTQGAST